MPHRPAPHSGLRRSDGFSLVELMLTAVIVGVVAAIGVPRYANALAGYQADASARRVVADLRRAQAHAEARSASARVWFRLSLDRVQILDLPDLEGRNTTYFTEIDEEPYRSTLTSADFGGDPYLVFDGYGRPDSGGSVTLRCGGHQRVITVDPDTGEASIQ